MNLSEVKISFKKWFEKNENKWLMAGLLVGIFAVFLPLVIFFVSGLNLSLKSFERLGTVGDYLGGTTVGLLSLSSILFLISTIVMQRKSLEIQQNELKVNTDALLKANEEYKDSNQLLTRQLFDNTFFNMIQIHNQLINDLKFIDQYENELTGRQVINNFYKSVNKDFRFINFNNYIKNLVEEIQPGREIENQVGILHDLKIIRNKYYYNGLINDNIIFEEDNLKEEVIEYESNDEILNILLKNQRYRSDFYFIEVLGLNDNENNQIVFENRVEYKHLLRPFWNNNIFKINAFNTVNIDTEYCLSNYIKSIKTIIRIIDNQKMTQDVKETYVDILFSQFTVHEIEVLKYFVEFGNECELKRYFDTFENLKTKESIKDSLLLPFNIR